MDTFLVKEHATVGFTILIAVILLVFVWVYVRFKLPMAPQNRLFVQLLASLATIIYLLSDFGNLTKELRVNGTVLTVRRPFSLTRRDFSVRQLRYWGIRSERRGGRRNRYTVEVVRLSFTGGMTLDFDAGAIGYDQLISYLNRHGIDQR